MKKIMMFMVAMMLVVGMNGQAMAYFEDGNLIRVVYDRGGTNEVVTDLGAGFNPSTAGTQGPALLNTNNFSLSQFGSNANFNNLYVAYFTLTVAPSTGPITAVWTSGTGSQNSISRAGGAFITNAHVITGGNMQSGLAQNVNLNAAGNSYWTKFDMGNIDNVGGFGTFLNPANRNGEANLGALATVGYVDQQIFYYNSPNNAQAGQAVYTIRTHADGTTEIVATPVPAAIYLLGSGLLGLIGIRRKMAA
jgi:hypothetical protein